MKFFDKFIPRKNGLSEKILIIENVCFRTARGKGNFVFA